MRLSGHVAVSGVVAAGVWWWTRETGLAVLSWIVGVFVDLDHVLDYVVFERRIPTNPGEVQAYYWDPRRSRLIVILLHGFEWLFGLVVWTWWAWPAPWLSVVTLSYAQHLVVDVVTNHHLHPWCYSLAFRARHGFSRQVLILSEPQQKTD